MREALSLGMGVGGLKTTWFRAKSVTLGARTQVQVLALPPLARWPWSPCPASQSLSSFPL